jgi:hypothetical protein
MHADPIYRFVGPRPGLQTVGLRTLSLILALLATAVGTTAFAQAPGPELFAKEPRTPLELWDAIDYLLRTNQGKKALPFLDKFIKSKPDDATLIVIRNRYGPGSVLRLNDHDATRPFAQTVAEAMVVAARKYATQPERIARFIGELTKTPEEQDYGVRHLREAGPDAIPYLIEALRQPDLPAGDRSLIVRNMGRLDRSVIPPLAAVLESPPDRAGRRPGGHRTSDRPAVLHPASYPSPGADGHGLALPSPPGGFCRRSCRCLGME